MKKKFAGYVAEKIGLQFSCKFGVYPENKGRSICYCTDDIRAELVVNALNMYVETPDFEKFMMQKEKETKKRSDVSVSGFTLLTKFPKGKNKKDRLT